MKMLRIAGGVALIGLGVVMLVTPGPGWVSIGLGLTLLATEYAWAREWREWLRNEGARLTHRVGRR